MERLEADMNMNKHSFVAIIPDVFLRLWNIDTNSNQSTETETIMIHILCERRVRVPLIQNEFATSVNKEHRHCNVATFSLFHYETSSNQYGRVPHAMPTVLTSIHSLRPWAEWLSNVLLNQAQTKPFLFHINFVCKHCGILPGGKL